MTDFALIASIFTHLILDNPCIRLILGGIYGVFRITVQRVLPKGPSCVPGKFRTDYSIAIGA
jgi:hypothetical protein